MLFLISLDLEAVGLGDLGTMEILSFLDTKGDAEGLPIEVAVPLEATLRASEVSFSDSVFPVLSVNLLLATDRLFFLCL